MGVRVENARSLYLEGIRDGDAAEAIARYTGDRYTQHSTGVKDGRDGFVEFFEAFIARNHTRDIDIVRSFEDGRYVFLHAVQNLNGGERRWVTADIFDTDDQGKLIEHWDVITAWTDDTVSGHGQVDGPTEPTDLDKTEANRALVTGFLTDVLQNGAHDKLTRYISSETYIQHNPQVADGLDGLGAFIRSLEEQGMSMNYTEIHKVVACGNFVATLSEVDLGGTGMAVIDLFRVEDGLIVEHWDVMEEIPPTDEWANTGKF